jgi:hypothetical protein
MANPPTDTRPSFIELVGSDKGRLTQDARRRLRRATTRHGQVWHEPKTRDEVLDAYLNALPDDLVQKWADFNASCDADLKAGGTE